MDVKTIYEQIRNGDYRSDCLIVVLTFLNFLEAISTPSSVFEYEEFVPITNARFSISLSIICSKTNVGLKIHLGKTAYTNNISCKFFFISMENQKKIFYSSEISKKTISLVDISHINGDFVCELYNEHKKSTIKSIENKIHNLMKLTDFLNTD